MSLHGKRGLVGTVFNPQDVQSAFVPFENQELDIAGMTKAKTMLEALVWDPCTLRKHPISVCSLPVQHNFSGAGAQMRGNFYMLHCIGKILEHSNGVIRAICFDSHGTHMYLRKVIHGDLRRINQDDLRMVPWFSSLEYEPVDSTLPRFPINICRKGQDVIWGLGGICDLAEFIFFLGGFIFVKTYFSVV